MRPVREVAALLTLVVLVGAARAGSESVVSVDRFRIDAEVNGVARSNLRELGKAAVRSEQLADRFRITAQAQVNHPEKKRLYKFAIDMTCSLTSRKLTVLEAANRFNAAAREVKDPVERVLPFMYVVKFLPVPGPAEEPARTFLARHGYFMLRYARLEGRVEVSLYHDDSLVGRFYLREGGRAPYDVDQIKILATPQVVVSFRREPERTVR
ncbi:MAG: hypothetical protein HY815_10410 [Candidatus Riflebacteria bacterium]|nr:hypothetical protein [Candidatus Riflebacteria bacterium]